MTTTLDLAARQGDTFRQNFTVGEGSPPDITPIDGDNARLEIAWYDAGEIVKVTNESGLTLNVGSKRIECFLTPTETSRLPPGRVARYELTYTKISDGDKVTLFEGYFDVTGKVVSG